jgi:hypothetical protein
MRFGARETVPLQLEALGEVMGVTSSFFGQGYKRIVNQCWGKYWLIRQLPNLAPTDRFQAGTDEPQMWLEIMLRIIMSLPGISR